MESKNKAKPGPKSRKRSVANFRKISPVSTTAIFRNLQFNNNHNKQDDCYIDSNSIIDISNLVELMKSIICVNCRQRWDGKIQCRKREGLYECLEFICYYDSDDYLYSTISSDEDAYEPGGDELD